MLVVVACVALVLLGVQIVVRRGGRPDERPPAGWVRYIALSLAAGLGAGALAAGAGGRLIMRLLALTSPDAAGVLTEADATVGEITAGGTLGFVLFVGLPAGFVSGVAYALVAPLVPSRRVRGLVVGVLLLALVAPRIDPLRSDNFDFLLLDPEWLAVLAFTVLAVFQGMLVAALAPAPIAAPRRRVLTAARVALALVLVAALPGFIDATGEILSG